MYMKKAKIIIITCILLSLTSVTLVFADSPTASFSNCQVILPQSVKPNQKINILFILIQFLTRIWLIHTLLMKQTEIIPKLLLGL